MRGVEGLAMKSSTLSIVVAASMAWGGMTRTFAQESAGAPPPPPNPLRAQEPPAQSAGYSGTTDPVEVAADALVVRPLGAAATVVGAAIWVVALPFAAISGDVKSSGRTLVGVPARFTFKRKLGDFEDVL
jgi:hypothetical protein